MRLAERAAALTGRTDAGVLATLAAAYAETARIPEAINLAEDAALLGRSSGDAETVKLTEKLLAAFRESRAYHE